MLDPVGRCGSCGSVALVLPFLPGLCIVTNRQILVYSLEWQNEDRPAVELLGFGIGRCVACGGAEWRGLVSVTVVVPAGASAVTLGTRTSLL